MEKITGTLITGHLAKTIEHYRKVEACHQVVKDFEHFTTEAIIYAKLEWSKFIRDAYDEKGRLKYLYEKCFMYDSPNVRMPIIDIIIDDDYGVVIKITQHPEEVVAKVDDDLPF
jgi:hypothetical protein